MSIINKMLQDLDARGNGRPGELPAEIKPVVSGAGKLPARRIAAIGAALIAVALGVAAWVALPLGKQSAEVPVARAPVAAPAAGTAAPQAPAATLRMVPEAAPAPAETARPDTPEAATASADAVAEKTSVQAPAPVKEDAPQQAARRPAVPAPPAAPTPPAVRTAPAVPAAPVVQAAASPSPDTAARETTSWAVANERARAEAARLARRWGAEEARIAALPAGEQAAARKRLRDEQARAEVRAKADAAWLAALKRKEASGGAPPSPAKERAEAGAPGIEAVTAQTAENHYRRALASLQDGRVNEAIAGMQAALRIQPRHEAARQTLVGLLIENNRGDEAMTQLQQALNLDPRQPALAMLLARLQIERGKSGIDTLLRTLPYAAGPEKGDYHAFLGGALQRQSRYAEAVEQYQTALRSAPGNAVWWMGLGIALQADKRNPEALDAFRQARVLGSLPPDLQAFVERKLQQLGR